MNTHLQLASNVIFDKLKAAGKSYAGSTSGVGAGTQLASIISGIIGAALSLLGVIFLVLIVYSGYVYLTAGGDESKVEKAKHTITRSIIGLAIVLCAFAISVFVVPAIMCATGAAGCPS